MPLNFNVLLLLVYLKNQNNIYPALPCGSGKRKWDIEDNAGRPNKYKPALPILVSQKVNGVANMYAEEHETAVKVIDPQQAYDAAYDQYETGAVTEPRDQLIIENANDHLEETEKMHDIQQIGAVEQPVIIPAASEGVKETALEAIGILEITEGITDPDDEGLLHYKKWWFRREVDLFVRGERITGTPIFLHGNTLRVVHEAFSYFIPLQKVDYIRTPDGYVKED